MSWCGFRIGGGGVAKEDCLLDHSTRFGAIEIIQSSLTGSVTKSVVSFGLSVFRSNGFPKAQRSSTCHGWIGAGSWA